LKQVKLREKSQKVISKIFRVKRLKSFPPPVVFLLILTKKAKKKPLPLLPYCRKKLNLIYFLIKVCPTPVRQPLAQQVYNTRATSQLATSTAEKNNSQIALFNRKADAASTLSLSGGGALLPDIILLNTQVIKKLNYKHNI
jgi:hypothetical protein